jgi:hypothetical protein
MWFKQLTKRITKHFLSLPGVWATYLWLSDTLGFVPVYDVGWRHLPSWLEEVKKVEKKHTMPCCHVLFFSVIPNWVDFSLALAVALVGRNLEVDFAWLPLYSTELGEYPYWRRQAKKVTSKSLHPRLRFHNLEEVSPAPVDDTMRAIAEEQAIKDVSYDLKKERIRIDSDPLDRKTFDYHRKRDLNAISRVTTLIKENEYDRVILPNGAIQEFGAVYRHISLLGIPVSAIETWIGDTVIAYDNPMAIFSGLNDLWAKDEPHFLSETRHARVQKILDTRREPRETSTPDYQKTQVIGLASPEQIRAQVGLCSDKPVVLICPNVPFDSIAYDTHKQVFPGGMWEWLVKTIDHFIERANCQVVVRSHPAESLWAVRETTKSLITEFFPALPDHIVVISPKAPVNTYSLMQIADLGIVYTSTTGLEMAMHGIPVICSVSSQHYNRRGFTIEPETAEEFFHQIDRILQNPVAYRLAPRQIELAWCYAEIFWTQWPKPFPWTAGRRHLWRGLRSWPMARMLSPEGDEKFGSLFRTLIDEQGR